MNRFRTAGDGVQVRLQRKKNDELLSNASSPGEPWVLDNDS